jgi:hypothetical protein
MLVETGLNQTLIGKRIMAATFVTDFGTVAALSVLFIKPTLWIVPFIVTAVVLIVGLPRIAPWFFARFGDRVIARGMAPRPHQKDVRRDDLDSLRGGST